MNAAGFFTTEGRQMVEQAIYEAEQNTSGEIRVHVETRFDDSVLNRASAVFALLKMHKTELRNGVLIYLGIKNRAFAIIGDVGINRIVPPGFWDETKSVMESYFKNGAFAEGLAAGIKMAGEQLKKHFPRQQDDINELPNEISFDTSE